MAVAVLPRFYVLLLTAPPILLALESFNPFSPAPWPMSQIKIYFLTVFI